MNKEYWRKVLGLSSKDKIVYYKNPNECNKYHIEKINPTHKAIIWGQRKHKGNWIKIGKIYFGSIFTSFFEYIRLGLEYISKNYDVFMFFYYIFIACMIYAVVLKIPVIEGVLSIGRYR